MFEQIKLTYNFDAMEPHIDRLTMETHYTKHHAAYTKNFNDALKSLPQFDGKSVEYILENVNTIEDAALRAAVINNGGGFYNHNLYFDTMSPDGGKAPGGKLGARIDKDFGSFDELKAQLSQAAAKRFGSGWAWLVTDKSGKLSVVSTPNQDNTLMDGKGLVPIMGIDVWEHAYYLKYKNMRADYVQSFFNVVDWNKVEKYYLNALSD